MRDEAPVILPWGAVSERVDVVAIACSGPASRSAEFERLKNRVPIIAVNSMGFVLPWADFWHSQHGTYGKGQQIPTGPGKRYLALPQQQRIGRRKTFRWETNITYLRRLDTARLTQTKEWLASGWNSGFSAYALACHMQPKLVVIFGLDLRPQTHGVYAYPEVQQGVFQSSSYVRGLRAFNEGLGGQAVPATLNGNLASGVTCFPRVTADEAIEEALACCHRS